MKKKEKTIGINRSSGAEKVETIEKEVAIKSETEGAGMRGDYKTAKGDSALGDSVALEEALRAKEKNAELRNGSAIRESERAKARVEEALAKKAAKERREKAGESRFAAYKKYVAEENARIEKRLAEKKVALEKRAKEREEALRERAHQKANRNQRKLRENNVGGDKHEGGEKKNGKHNRESYGGWIAAVVALGVISLALATTVTVGAVEMKALKEGVAGSQMSTMYELTGTMEHIDDDLDRIRVSDSPSQQARILTDILVQSRIAECDLEKLPLKIEEEQNVTAFINRTAKESERLLAKLRNGERLTETDKATLSRLYKANHTVREELDGMLEKMTKKDWTDYVKDGAGMIGETLQRIEKFTLEENRAMLEGKTKETMGAGMERTQNEGGDSMDALRAAEVCKKYFNQYKIEDFQCVGETVNERYSAYNVQGYDEKGSMLFAEIDRKSGALIGFDYYEEGNAENFSRENAERIAEEFLTSLGYTDMEIERLGQSGSTAEFTFVYVKDGVAYYPDAIKVKVCRTRGLVCGMDATRFLKNHRDRDEMNPKIMMETAYAKLNDKLSVDASRVVVVETARGERVAYEMLCSYEDGKYLVYIDGTTGDEIAILNAKNVNLLGS